MEWRGAEEAFEACSANVGIAFMVDVPLVVLEDGVFFFREGVCFERDGEVVLGLDVGFELRGFGFVYGGEKVEGVVLLLLLATWCQSVCSDGSTCILTYALVFGYFLLTSLVYFSPSTYRFHLFSVCR